MKVLHFFKTYYPDGYGGVEQVIFQLAEEGVSHGLENHVLTLTPYKAGTITVASHPVHRVKRLFKIASTDISLAVLSKFRKLASEADIVHYHFPWPMADLAHFLVRHRKPTVLTYHSDIVAQQKLLPLYHPLMMNFLKDINAIVTTSPQYGLNSPVLRLFADKTVCIPLGISPLPAPSDERISYWHSRFGSCFLLFIGAFRYYKGLQYLLKAIKGLSIPLVLVGGGSEEPALRRQAKDSGLENVYFLGKLSDEEKSELLAACYALVLPSHLRSEAFGLSLLEGAMFSKPLICCEIGTGTSYVNQHGLTGYVVPPADPIALRKALLALWNNPEQALAMGNSAFSRYQSLFTSQKMFNGYLRLYEQLVHEKL